MCNLYHMSPATTSRSSSVGTSEGFGCPRRRPGGIEPTVGPFDTGLFLRTDREGGVVGEFGQ